VTAQFRIHQVWTIARIEMRRAFFSKRAFWVYGLALLPALMFLGHGIDVKLSQKRFSARGLTPAAAIDSITRGQTEEEILRRVGKPCLDRTWTDRRRIVTRNGDDVKTSTRRIARRNMTYFDGRRRAHLQFEEGILKSVSVRPLANLEEDRAVFAAVFQFFYLRLAIFFGCLGIFMNMFRGEILDKTLHFWFLAPARREILLAGKYMAGLLAAGVIFATGALLCFGIMLWPHDPFEVQAYWQGSGLSHALGYAATAALGCVGYGSVFLAAGMLLRNPIIPAVVLLFWDSINGFLPAMLQKLSILYYLQSICPVPMPIDKNTSALARLFLAPAAPASPFWAVTGLLALTVLVLWIASRAVRRIEINYSTE
jgi:hypothetical protein